MSFKIVFGVVACGLAVIFCALGFWQLRRLSERRAQNAMLASRRFHPPLSIDSIPADTSLARFRRVRISGAYDFQHEFALTLRTRNGSPGVNIITPLLRAGNDTLILVNRGWIYAPDGMTADISRWPEPDTVGAIGFIETFPPPREFAARSPGRARAYRWLDRSVVSKDLGRPVAPYYLVIAPDSEWGVPAAAHRRPATQPVAELPPRVEPRSLDEGPHRSYAIQWFSFAAISIIGLIFFLRRA
jgi:surfeit locus 1 family protein